MNNLLKIRTELGLTQVEMSTRLGISRTALFDAEHKHISLLLAKRVAETFDLNLFYVLGTDVLLVLPKNEEDAFFLRNIIKDL